MNAQSFAFPYSVQVPTSHWDRLLAVDLFASCGTPILAVFDGLAVARDYPLGGHTVMLTATDGTEAYFAHLAATGVSGWVSAGQVIGYVGDTGNARGTGCHLHFAVGYIDNNGAGTIAPWQWLANIDSDSYPVDDPIIDYPIVIDDVIVEQAKQWLPWFILGGLIAVILKMR